MALGSIPREEREGGREEGGRKEGRQSDKVI
jgi:hypothetical protein